MKEGYIKKKGKSTPFGYELSEIERYFQPIPLELEVLQKYVQFIIDKKYSLREASALIEEESGRKLNHVSLKAYVDKELKRQGITTTKQQYGKQYKRKLTLDKKERLDINHNVNGGIFVLPEKKPIEAEVVEVIEED